jgi:tyrosine-protein kinase Etk/Wzc
LGVAFLPAGVPAGSPAHLLGSPSLRNAIQAAEKQYDLVVIDSPPVLAGADTWLIGSNAGMTLMLARWRHTPIKRTALAVRLLALSKSKLVGVALSIVNVGENARYDHGDAILFSSAMQRYYTDVPAVAFQPTRAVANAADPK